MNEHNNERMKTRTIYQGIALLAMALTTTACQNELNEPAPQPGEKVEMTIRATQAATPQTRTIYEDKLEETGINQILVKWEGGNATNAPVENMRVYGREQNQHWKFNASDLFTSDPKTLSADGRSINFTGKVTPAYEYMTVYPAEGFKQDADGNLAFSFLGQEQDCALGRQMEHLKKYDAMIGRPVNTGDNTTVPKFNFLHLPVMLRFVLSLPQEETATSLTLNHSNEYGIPTEVYIPADPVTPRPQSSNEQQSITLGLKNVPSSKTLTAYMMLPDGLAVESYILTITLNTASGTTYEGSLEVYENSGLTPGKCYTLRPNQLKPTTTLNIPPVSETGKLGEALSKVTPNGQTELVVAGPVKQSDLTALSDFLQKDNAQTITTLDLSGLRTADEMGGKIAGLGSCAALTTVILPTDATEIGYEAFRSCTALTTVIQHEPIVLTRASVSSKMKVIGQLAFADCTSLTTMFLHANIAKVGKNAFYNCTALTALVFEGTKEPGSGNGKLELGSGIVAGASSDLNIYLPMITDETVATAYKTVLSDEATYHYDYKGGQNAYNSASEEERLKAESYNSTLSNGGGNGGKVDGFEPGNEWGK